MPLFLANINLNRSELQNAVIHVLAADPGTPAEGQVYYNSTDKVLKFRHNAAWIVLGRLDQVSGPTASVSLNSQKIVSLGTPTVGTDATTKDYVDGLATGGVAWKNPVRAATTAAGTLALSFANASVIDGVTLVTGDRILLKDQAAGAENGLYTVNAAGAPTRSTDADSAAEVLAATAFVTEGTANADLAFTMTTNAPIVLNTTALVFVQISGLGQITAGAGLTKTGNTLDVIGTADRITVAADAVDVSTAYVGQASITTLGTITTGVWTGTDVAVADGGTGAGTAAGAKTNLGFMTRYAADVGDGAAVAYVLTHNLNTRDVQVAVYRSTTPWEQVIVDVEATSVNTITLRFATAPASNAFRAVVVG